ncbi:724_t:CDS:1 [Acaulospora colombiana]|uniref:724_t:CDS:1 n=1 Tax=Acaulospora colombiana TaxID=27376 RepID=A0ACA9LGF4_9GLOM|nr:724_t:CDS:1 [Acaulospora colombiana]
MQQQPSGYRPIVPAPPTSQAFVPISPHHSPSTHPSPHHSPPAHPNPQQSVISLPFETPPVSPFSHPMHNDYAGQFKLPPPLQPLTPLAMPGSQHMMLPVSPTAIMSQQQNCVSAPRAQQPSQSSQSRYERILPKQTGPSTSVLPITLNQSSGSTSTQNGTRPAMQYHTSIIHPLVPHHHNYRSASSDKPLTTADQRELARKVSHSAIERRRRERINDKILQLKELIPSCADQDHLHKLSILQSAIEYIQYLQGIVAASRQRERDGKDDGRSSEDGRLVKRSKFDRYDILPPNSRKFDSFDDREEYRHKKGSTSSSSPSSPDQEKTSENVDDSEKEVKSDDDDATSTDATTKAVTSSSSPISHDHEDAKALLMLSNSESSMNEDSGKQTTTKDSETQTSPTQMWEPSQESDSHESDHEEESPRRGMTVQQMLC